MRTGSKKGFILLDDLAIIAMVSLALYFVTPVVTKGFNALTGNADRVHKTMHSKVSQEPVTLGVDEKGKNIIGYKTKNEASTETLSEEMQPTLWQKLKTVIWWVVGIAVFSAVFPASVVAKIKNLAMAKASDKFDELQTKHDTLKAETTKIINGVKTARAAMDDATKTKMTVILNDAYNDTTKALVTDVKDNGTITSL